MPSQHSVRQAKIHLRQVYRTQRDQIHPAKRQLAAVMVARRFFAAKSVAHFRKVMIYAPIRSEIDPTPLGQRAAELGWEVYLPRMRGQHDMEAVRVNADVPLEPGRYGILQPAEQLEAVDPTQIDAIIVPGIAFDLQGYRLGYGAGYYDRFLPRAKGVLWIGLTYDDLLVPTLPAEDHDQRLDAVLTDKRWHWTGARGTAHDKLNEARENS